MPKTKTAKMASITMETLLLAHELAGSACTLLRAPHEDPRVDNIGRQLEDIKAHLGIPSKVGMPQKLSYAVPLATGLKSSVLTLSLPSPPPPCPWPRAAGQYNITLTQKHRDKPVLMDMPKDELVARIFAALWAAQVWYEERPLSPD